MPTHIELYRVGHRYIYKWLQTTIVSSMYSLLYTIYITMYIDLYTVEAFNIQKESPEDEWEVVGRNLRKRSVLV